MKILSLSVSAGNGHAKAAEAVQDYFRTNNKEVEMEIIDTLKYINPIIDKVVIGSYLNSLKKTPSIYAKLYKIAETEDTISNISEIINHALSGKIKGLIDQFNADAILCTHPFPLEMVSILKRKKKISTPVVAILTDYAPHSFWLYDYIDAYVIPHEDFTQDLIEKGIGKDSIYAYGIPVNKEFLENYDKVETRIKLGLDPHKLTLMIMGGGLGIGNIKKIYENLAFSSLDVQLITCTGSNIKLRNQILDISSRCNKKTMVFDYTDKISELMSASDILITKPGGITITESLNKHLPIIITSAIPGQEERNANYLLNNGVAARVTNIDSIVSLVKQLTKSSIRLNHMIASANEKAKPLATKQTCELIMRLAEETNTR